VYVGERRDDLPTRGPDEPSHHVVVDALDRRDPRIGEQRLDAVVDAALGGDEPTAGVDRRREPSTELLAFVVADGGSILEAVHVERARGGAVVGRPAELRDVDRRREEGDARVGEAAGHRLGGRRRLDHDPADEFRLPRSADAPEDGDVVRADTRPGRRRHRGHRFGHVGADPGPDRGVARPRERRPGDRLLADEREGSRARVETLPCDVERRPVATSDGRRVESLLDQVIAGVEQRSRQEDERRRPVAVALAEVVRRLPQEQRRRVVQRQSVEKEAGRRRGRHATAGFDDELVRPERPDHRPHEAADATDVGQQLLACVVHRPWLGERPI
jgi:hypothetical protein